MAEKYSQSDEQLYILDYFLDKSDGKFLDIGAFHVFKFSNVRALYEKGFSGVLVEPQPENYFAIADHYKNEPRIEVLNVAIGAESGEIDFYESGGDAVGTTDLDHMKKWSDGGVKYTKIKVKQVSVNEFMHEYCFDVDMLSIDTEATNMVIFRNMPEFVWKQIRLLVIEHDGFQKEIEDKLTDYGFTKLYENGENILLAKL